MVRGKEIERAKCTHVKAEGMTQPPVSRGIFEKEPLPNGEGQER
jgi:hypothetical protein